jgi:hypothetical protein
MCDPTAPIGRELIPRNSTSRATRFLLNFCIPLVVYFLAFCVLLFPLIRVFSTRFFCDCGDGLQNEWNIWWIHKAILQVHQSPWFTTWIHAPAGTTLVAHTLNPINGLIALPLSAIFSPVQVYNLIVIGTYLTTGLTTYWLALYVAQSRIAALFAGFAFTFTGYRVAHTVGHMQLISTEFLPLFLLAWLRMLESPSFVRAVVAGIVLGIVGLCDLYYVSFCVMIGATCVPFYWRQLRATAQLSACGARRLVRQFGLFALVSLICCGPQLFAVLRINATDPLLGAHEPETFSADLLAPFMPTGAEFLGRYTARYWQNLPSDVTESSQYVGLTVLLMGIAGIVFGRHTGGRRRIWIGIAVVAYVLSLGPVLHVAGVPVTRSLMPFAWLEVLLPSLRLSGCPGRIAVMYALASSILMAYGIAAVGRSGGWRARVVLPLFAILMVGDLWPGQLPTTIPQYPAWTRALHDLPRPGAVICPVGEHCWPLWYQTLYDRPNLFGYVSRFPNSVNQRDAAVVALARGHRYADLQRMGFAYVVLAKERSLPGLPIVYSDAEVNIQEIK